MSHDDTRTGELPWTGERYVPEITGDIELEHLHRYAIARDLAYGKDVLDIACGEGYGSELLATVARKVTGVDISEEAIDHAARKYVRPNIGFAVGSCACIPLADASIDLIVSFETIEHHDRHLEMMQEIRRVLRPAGVLIISSPDKHAYSDVQDHKNPYHVKELFASEFADLLSTQFRHVSVLGQRVFSASFVAPTNGSRVRFVSYRRSDKTVQCEPGVIRPIYYIALASNGILPEIQGGLYEGGSCSRITGRDKHIANRASWAGDNRDQQVDRINQALAERDRLRQALQAVFNSTSWKVSAPLRWLGRLGNQLGRYYRSGECRMRLQSLRHIKSADGLYESTGRDPSFLLETYGAYFKSDWNPDLMRGQNMISHLGVYRRSLLESIGGFRLGYEGSQDYDLALRAVERTTPERIRHIPHVLYHWRVFSQSGSFSASDLPRATRAARRAVQDHLDRLGTGATVGPAPGLESYSRVIYPLPVVPPPVTLIVPTRDKVELLSECVSSLIDRTDYPDFDVIIVDNGSREAETLAYFASLEKESRVKILPFDREFNYSAINNFAVVQARGSVIGLINNDIQVIEPGWLKEMVSHVLHPEVGAVGAKLLYPDERVQHAGVITGINGVANHAHRFYARDGIGYFGRLVLTQDYSCVTAACLVMRKAVYEEVGGLDETNLAVSYNDMDLCLRIRDKRYLVVWTPHAQLYHMESASRGPDTHPEQAERARNEVCYMKARWGESLLRDPYYNHNLSLDDVTCTLAFPPRAQKPWLHQLQNHSAILHDNIHVAGSWPQSWPHAF